MLSVRTAFLPAAFAALMLGAQMTFWQNSVSGTEEMVDLLVFAGDTFSLETLLPLGIAAAAALGFIVYKIQRKWYNDDHESALIKAMIIALLTAIPVPVTPLLAVPGGLIAIAGGLSRRKVSIG